MKTIAISGLPKLLADSVRDTFATDNSVEITEWASTDKVAQDALQNIDLLLTTIPDPKTSSNVVQQFLKEHPAGPVLCVNRNATKAILVSLKLDIQEIAELNNNSIPNLVKDYSNCCSRIEKEWGKAIQNHSDESVH